MAEYTDGEKLFYVRSGLASDHPERNFKVFFKPYSLPWRGGHGYTGKGNPWTSERAAEINLDALAKKHGWRRF